MSQHILSCDPRLKLSHNQPENFCTPSLSKLAAFLQYDSVRGRVKVESPITQVVFLFLTWNDLIGTLLLAALLLEKTIWFVSPQRR
jgi:hypothetical protein